MSQVELHAVNHTAFPRYERAAKRALEVVLSPGDALYIPPYWLHQVTALSGPCSASVSVHTDSESARIRDQMLSHQLPIRDEWAAPQRAAALAVYVTALFSSQAERQTFVAGLLAARYDPLVVDARVLGNSPGLAEVIESAREGFSARFSERGQRVRGGRAQLSDSVVHVVREHAQRFARITRRIDGRGGLLRHQKAAELGNYIEDVVAAAIGAEWVDPFLRALTLDDPTEPSGAVLKTDDDGGLVLVLKPTTPGLQVEGACSSVPDTILGFGRNLGHTIRVASAADCCDKCRSTQGCVSWTFHEGCHLHDCVGPKSAVSGAVSGVPHGPVPKRFPTCAPSPPQTCDVQYLGCYREIVPAPGVPPIRAIGHLIAGPSKDLTASTCAAQCSDAGFPYAGLDSESGQQGLSCYCGCARNKAAPAQPNTTNKTCSAGSGTMAAFHLPCGNATACGAGPGRLPAGPACSQAEAKQWTFCDSSKSLDERVEDLVSRISVEEAGALLTARESPAIPRLGIPPFYWGTNAIHGVQWGNATTFASPIALASTWNRSVFRGVGRVIGRELRAMHNIGIDQNAAGLTSWSPTINIIRDPRARSALLPLLLLCVGSYCQLGDVGIRLGPQPGDGAWFG